MSVADTPFPAHLTDPKVALKNLLSDETLPPNAPPAYKVAVHELITNFQKKLEEDPDALAREFTKAFNSNEVDKVFNDRMLALVDSTVALERDFANVKKATLTFDLKKYKKYDARSNTYSAIPEFHPDWKDLDQRYTDLLWESRNIAVDIQQRIKFYHEKMLPMLGRSNVSTEEKLENINYFLGITAEGTETNFGEKLKKDENEAQRISEAFDALKEAVASFGVKLKQAREDAKLGVAQEVSDLEANVNKIVDKLNDLKIWRNATAIGAALGVGVVAALAPFALVTAGIIALAALGCGIYAAVDQFKLIPDAEEELKTAKAALVAGIARQNEILNVIIPQINTAVESCNDICTQLSNFAAIFRHIKNDAQAARLQLEASLEDGVPRLARQDHIDMATAAYKRLGLCVYMYADGFDRAAAEEYIKPKKS